MAKKTFRKYTISGQIIVNFIFILFALLCVVPVLLVFAVSITSEGALESSGYTLFPSEITWNAYKYIFESTGQIINAYKITTIVTVLGTFLSLAITTLYAYPISRPELKYRNFFTFFLFFTMIFSGGLIPTYMVYVNMLHMKNTIWALIVPSMMGAWNVLVMKSFFSSSIPNEVIESVKIDGAGDFMIFLKFVLPLSLPGLATITLFTSVAYWNDWMLPLYYITDDELFNLQYLLYSIMNNIEYLTENASRMGMGIMAEEIPSESARMAMCILALGPVVLVYPFLQKYFIKGLTIGAIKG